VSVSVSVPSKAHISYKLMPIELGATGVLLGEHKVIPGLMDRHPFHICRHFCNQCLVDLCAIFTTHFGSNYSQGPLDFRDCTR